MKNLQDLSRNELQNVNGGESIGYYVGYALGVAGTIAALPLVAVWYWARAVND